MGAGSRQPIDGPQAVAPRMGLLASALTPRSTEAQSRWENGFSYEDETCITPGAVLDACSPGEFSTGTEPTEVEWEPYAVFADYACTALVATPERLSEIRSATRRRLQAVEGWQIERELWTGTLAQAQSYPNRFLADVDNVDILTESGAATPTDGLACLVQYLAENNGGSQGMIHATPQVVTLWTEANLLYRLGNEIRVIATDDVVVPGRGYTGGDPDGNDAVTGDVWAYATDMVTVRLGGIIQFGADPSGIDRTNNRINARAERLAVASWSGCRHAGARLSVEVCGIGGS